MIWAEDVIGPALRGHGSQKAELTVDNSDVRKVVTTDEGTADIFLQQVEGNGWQAENLGLTESGLADATTGKLPVTFVDWGDNLEVKDWSTKQKIRVETRLLQDVSAPWRTRHPAGGGTSGTGMTGYAMVKYGRHHRPRRDVGCVATKVRHLDGWPRKRR